MTILGSVEIASRPPHSRYYILWQGQGSLSWFKSMVILSIDIGTVRVGCAWADSSVKIPFPVAVWERAQGRAEKALLKEIALRHAALLVVGLPLGPDGQQTAMCDSVKAFVTRLSKRTAIQVAFVDESFTSQDALDRLHQAGASAPSVDAHAACLILEHYFSSSSSSSSDPSSK